MELIAKCLEHVSEPAATFLVLMVIFVLAIARVGKMLVSLLPLISDRANIRAVRLLKATKK